MIVVMVIVTMSVMVVMGMILQSHYNLRGAGDGDALNNTTTKASPDSQLFKSFTDYLPEFTGRVDEMPTG